MSECPDIFWTKPHDLKMSFKILDKDPPLSSSSNVIEQKV